MPQLEPTEQSASKRLEGLRLGVDTQVEDQQWTHTFSCRHCQVDRTGLVETKPLQVPLLSQAQHLSLNLRRVPITW